MSLDPDDWQSVRDVGVRMVGDMLDWQQSQREKLAWQPVPPEVKSRFEEPAPRLGMPLHEVYDRFLNDILPYPTGNAHPRFWGWVMGNGTPAGMLADMLAAGMNSHVAGFDQAASVVERQVLDWLRELIGFPAGGSGLLVTGGTAANLNGLLAARAAKAGWDVRQDGVLAGPPMTVYGSAETHNSALKACDLMGLGRQAFRKVAVGGDYRLDLGACRTAIVEDLDAGRRPIAIVGNVGTVNTAAIDDLHGIRALADEFGLWFHVDGAFGSMVAWSPSSHLVAGQELADSIAFDLHKWGYMPYDVGVILTRDANAQRAAFEAPAGAAAYLSSMREGIAADSTYFADRGIELTRSFRALKVWMSMKEQGVDRIGAAIQENIEQARYLGARVGSEPELELLTPVSLNTVCFRYAPRERSGEMLDVINRDVLTQLQLRGIAVPSQTILGECFAIRVCITNHRTEYADLDVLLDAVLDLGREIAERLPTEALL